MLYDITDKFMADMNMTIAIAYTLDAFGIYCLVMSRRAIKVENQAIKDGYKAIAEEAEDRFLMYIRRATVCFSLSISTFLLFFICKVIWS